MLPDVSFNPLVTERKFPGNTSVSVTVAELVPTVKLEEMPASDRQSVSAVSKCDAAVLAVLLSAK
jgi:hypothetical protein